MRKVLAILLMAVLAVGLVWFGCSKEPTAPTGELQQAAKPVSGPVGLERAMAVQNEHTPRLMAMPGVVGTATGLGSDGTPAVLVLTQAPDIGGISRNLDGIPVIVKITGEIRALQSADVDPKIRFDRPVPIGVSTGNIGECSSGTIACRVRGIDGKVYALSNNHVSALENKARKGSKILQPGRFDTAPQCAILEEDVIGTLADFQRIKFSFVANNRIDAAIALSSMDMLGNSTPEGGYGSPQSDVVPAAVGQTVQKYGRTTLLTTGSITGINATVNVGYTSGTARFVDQIIVESSSAVILPGDSGSLLATDPGCNPVGLLFAGNESGTFAVANRIDLVLDRFGVTIDDGSGGGNIPPTADFSYTTADLIATFTDQSTDPDGSIASWNWDFGDGVTSTEQNPTHTYETSGTYTVTLTVTDDQGATDSVSKDVTVTSSGGGTAPTLSDCDPASGNPGQRLTVAITGTNFQAGATVDFGSRIVVQEVTFVHSSQLEVRIRIHPRAGSGSRNVTVTNPDGESGTLAGGFTVN